MVSLPREHLRIDRYMPDHIVDLKPVTQCATRHEPMPQSPHEPPRRPSRLHTLCRIAASCDHATNRYRYIWSVTCRLQAALSHPRPGRALAAGDARHVARAAAVGACIRSHRVYIGYLPHCDNADVCSSPLGYSWPHVTPGLSSTLGSQVCARLVRNDVTGRATRPEPHTRLTRTQHAVSHRCIACCPRDRQVMMGRGYRRHSVFGYYSQARAAYVPRAAQERRDV